MSKYLEELNVLQKEFETLNAIDALLESLKINENAVTNSMRCDIINSYRECHRHYHTLDHIVDCFAEFEGTKSLFKHPLLSKYVLATHDLVYIPCFKYNEAASAAKTRIMSYSLGLSQCDSEIVSAGIMATDHAHYKVSLLDNNFNDEKLIKDIDLSILGVDWEKFKTYEDNIRKEFWFCSDADYIEGRDIFMSTLLTEQKIFLTDYFNDKYEKKARENIKHLLDVLTTGL